MISIYLDCDAELVKTCSNENYETPHQNCGTNDVGAVDRIRKAGQQVCYSGNFLGWWQHDGLDICPYCAPKYFANKFTRLRKGESIEQKLFEEELFGEHSEL